MPVTPERQPETIIALDYGLRRIGVAVGQQVTGSATPLAVIGNGDTGPDWRALSAIVASWRPSRLIVGMPAHADGSASALSARVATFVGQLSRFGLPVETVDERYSSLEAGQILKARRAAGARRRVRKASLDSTAAMLIAERWLGGQR
ncbi:MAG: Holliday junction resolvase RuvX [Woeseiaceae bacterium]